jgi:2-polyprenyl-3-methyl-5-hydroxy-6-metoxy-1,4-benzoquinol methylase
MLSEQSRGFRTPILATGEIRGVEMAKRAKRPKKHTRNPSTESESVVRYLEDVGFVPRLVADDFWKKLLNEYGDLAHDFQTLVDQRRTGEAGSAEYLAGVDTLYRLKNASLDFSVAITSQYFGRLYESYLAMVESLGLDRQAKSVLDVGCDNGILTSFYAKHFAKATVVGVDRCAEGLKCATDLSERLNQPRPSYLHADAFASAPHTDLTQHKWDIVFMTLCGYEQLDRQPETHQAIAQQLFRYLSPGGTAVVMEYPSTEILADLQVLARNDDTWTLTYEAFGGDAQQVLVSVLDTHR